MEGREDDFETFWSGKMFLDAEGNPLRVVEHVWGSDTFVKGGHDFIDDDYTKLCEVLA